jgi:pimeloyl-ACP methyl ester carboxylesterase
MSIRQRPVAVAAAPTGTGTRLHRYRQAEQEWWDHHGLKPVERILDVDSPAVRLRIVEVGSGKPVLFVHGTAGAAPVWAPLVRELKGFRCLLLDRPGWGLSSPIDYAQAEYKSLVAKILSGALDSLGVEKAHIVGGSIGNLWALRFAEAHPDRVDRLVLVGGGPLVPEIQVPAIVRVIASPLGAIMLRLPEKPGRVRAIVRGNGDGASLDAGRMDEFIRWRVALGRDTDSMLSERAMIRSIVNWRQGSFRLGLTLEDVELAAIQPPTFMIYGNSDPVGAVDTWRRFVEKLPQAELHIVDEAGHMPWFHDPTKVASDVSRFLHDSQEGDRSG